MLSAPTSGMGQDLGYVTNNNDYIGFQRDGLALNGEIITYSPEAGFTSSPLTGTFTPDTLNIDVILPEVSGSDLVRYSFEPIDGNAAWIAQYPGFDLNESQWRATTLKVDPIAQQMLEYYERNTAVRGEPIADLAIEYRARIAICQAQIDVGVISQRSCLEDLNSRLGVVVPAAQAPLWEVVATAGSFSQFQARTIDANQTLVAVDESVLFAMGEATDWKFQVGGFDASAAIAVDYTPGLVPDPPRRPLRLRFVVSPGTIFERMENLSETVDAIDAAVSDIFENVSSTGQQCRFGRRDPLIQCMNHSSEFGLPQDFWILSWFYLDIEDASDPAGVRVNVVSEMAVKYNLLSRVPPSNEFQIFDPKNEIQVDAVRFILESFALCVERHFLPTTVEFL
jgi:hypothetical protein